MSAKDWKDTFAEFKETEPPAKVATIGRIKPVRTKGHIKKMCKALREVWRKYPTASLCELMLYPGGASMHDAAFLKWIEREMGIRAVRNKQTQHDAKLLPAHYSYI